MCFQPVMPNSVMPDSVMLNSYLMLYHIPLYHFPLYLIPDCPLECYNRFLFSVIPDSIISDSVIPDSCFDIPDSVIPNSIIPDSCFACYNRFRYTRFPAPIGGGNRFWRPESPSSISRVHKSGRPKMGRGCCRRPNKIDSLFRSSIE